MFLYHLERAPEAPREATLLREFQEACCEQIRGVLPEEADDWLRTACAYRLREVTPAELETVRVAAWKYLGPRSLEVTIPEVCAVRAVICLLFPDDYSAYDDETPVRITRFESLDWFLRYANCVSDGRVKQLELLRTLFPNVEASQNT